MKSKIAFFVNVVLVFLLPGAAYPQQDQKNPNSDIQKAEVPQQESVADAARRMRAEKVSFEGTQPPQIVRATPSIYPPEAREGHRSGTVVMEVLVGKEGNVVKATVVSGDPIFHAAALATIKEWTYRPATVEGKPVDKMIQIRLNFSDKPARLAR